MLTCKNEEYSYNYYISSYLIKAGADVNIKNNAGKTALRMSKWIGTKVRILGKKIFKKKKLVAEKNKSDGITT